MLISLLLLYIPCWCIFFSLLFVYIIDLTNIIHFDPVCIDWTVFSHEYTVHLHRVTSSFLLNGQTRFIHYTSTQLEATDTFQNDDVIIILLQLWHRVFIHEWSWVQSMNFKLAGSKFTTYLKESAGFKF